MTKALTAFGSVMDHAAARDVAVCLKALAHPARLLILQALQAGERSVSAIEAATGVHQPILSRELAKLRDTGLVEARRVSKTVFYRQASALDLAELQAVLGFAVSQDFAGSLTPQTGAAQPKAGVPVQSEDTSASLFARAGWPQA